jgi:hypothetical protein
VQVAESLPSQTSLFLQPQAFDRPPPARPLLFLNYNFPFALSYLPVLSTLSPSSRSYLAFQPLRCRLSSIFFSNLLQIISRGSFTPSCHRVLLLPITAHDSTISLPCTLYSFLYRNITYFQRPWRTTGNTGFGRHASVCPEWGCSASPFSETS